MALHRERCLPSGVIGPVLFNALRRLASICLNELIEAPAEQLGSFRHGDGPAPERRQSQILDESGPKESWQFPMR